MVTCAGDLSIHPLSNGFWAERWAHSPLLPPMFSLLLVFYGPHHPFIHRSSSDQQPHHMSVQLQKYLVPEARAPSLHACPESCSELSQLDGKGNVLEIGAAMNDRLGLETRALVMETEQQLMGLAMWQHATILDGFVPGIQPCTLIVLNKERRDFWIGLVTCTRRTASACITGDCWWQWIALPKRNCRLLWFLACNSSAILRLCGLHSTICQFCDYLQELMEKTHFSGHDSTPISLQNGCK